MRPSASGKFRETMENSVVNDEEEKTKRYDGSEERGGATVDAKFADNNSITGYTSATFIHPSIYIYIYTIARYLYMF